MPVRRLVHEGTELTASSQTLLTFSANLVEGGAIVVAVTVANRSSGNRRVTVHFVPSGGSPTETNCIFEENVPAQTSRNIPGGPWWGNSSSTVRAISDTADSDVGVRVTAMEEYLTG